MNRQLASTHGRETPSGAFWHWRSEFHTTMLITSHYMEEVDQIALIARGRIVAIRA
jgi:hypothetical protein